LLNLAESELSTVDTLTDDQAIADAVSLVTGNEVAKDDPVVEEVKQAGDILL